MLWYASQHQALWPRSRFSGLHFAPSPVSQILKYTSSISSNQDRVDASYFRPAVTSKVDLVPHTHVDQASVEVASCYAYVKTICLGLAKLIKFRTTPIFEGGWRVANTTTTIADIQDELMINNLKMYENLSTLYTCRPRASIFAFMALWVIKLVMLLYLQNKHISMFLGWHSVSIPNPYTTQHYLTKEVL